MSFLDVNPILRFAHVHGVYTEPSCATIRSLNRRIYECPLLSVDAFPGVAAAPTDAPADDDVTGGDDTDDGNSDISKEKPNIGQRRE